MSVILYEKKNGIGIITLNRPEKRNALNSAMINGLGQYLHEAADDSDVKVIVIRAEGEKAFTAGFDLKESMEHNITDIVGVGLTLLNSFKIIVIPYASVLPLLPALAVFIIVSLITQPKRAATTE